MSSYLIDQEAWLAFYAERIGVDPANLGERDIRLGLALYHAAYLPAAATIELRLNELDLLQRYAEFGFVPDVPSAATGKVKVVIQNPAVNSYTLMAPFVVTQGDLRFVATEALTIPAGGTIGMATIRAELQGVDGTPQEAAASITVSAGWLRGAAISITDVTPGRDGSDLAAISAEFQAYAFNPQALVRAEDHAAYARDHHPGVGRALHAARTQVTYSGSYSKTLNSPGHLSLALITPDGAAADNTVINEVKAKLLRVTVPYGDTALHVVPAYPVPIDGTIEAVMQAGRDVAAQKEDILVALADHLSWRNWPDNRHVFAGDLWGVISEVPGIRYVTKVEVSGEDLGGSPSSTVYELEPWEFPTSAFQATDITLTE